MLKTSQVVLLWGSLAGTLCGQDVTVQQPIVGVTSLNTSVTVPDRGRVLPGA